MKQRIQGFVAGAVLMALLFGTLTVSAATTRDISVMFNNIRLVVNGQLVTPRDAQGNVVEPFIWEGTTYLPVRAIADALQLPVHWDGDTQTVYLGGANVTTALPAPLPALVAPEPPPPPATPEWSPHVEPAPMPTVPVLPPVGPEIPVPLPEPLPVPVPRAQALLEAVPQFEGSTGQNTINLGIVHIHGNVFPNTIRTQGEPFSSLPVQTNGWSNHNLNGQFSSITGTIARIDGSGGGTSSISFTGDGRTLASFIVDGNTMPTDISVDVRGINILLIQIEQPGGGAYIAFVDAMIE